MKKKKKTLTILKKKYTSSFISEKIKTNKDNLDFIEKIKKDEKSKLITQDESIKFLKEIQKITDEYTSQIDKLISIKQEEILKV